MLPTRDIVAKDWHEPIGRWFRKFGLHLGPLEVLGAGNFGEVVVGKVIQSTNKRFSVGLEIALKVSKIREGEHRPFENEATVLRAIAHLGIGPKFYYYQSREVHDVNGQLLCTKDILAMQRISGSSLFNNSICVGKPMRQVLIILKLLSHQLLLLHECGYIHLDIKEDNIIISFADEDPKQIKVVIVDFGLARPIGKLACCGTPTYKAPEHCDKASPATTFSDVYSLGQTTLYQLSKKVNLTFLPPYMDMHDRLISPTVKTALKHNLKGWREGHEAAPCVYFLLNKMLQGRIENRITMRTVAMCADLLLDGRYEEVKTILNDDASYIDDLCPPTHCEASYEDYGQGSMQASAIGIYYGSTGSQTMQTTSSARRSDFGSLDRSCSERPVSTTDMISSSVEKIGPYDKDDGSIRSSLYSTPQSPALHQSSLAMQYTLHPDYQNSQEQERQQHQPASSTLPALAIHLPGYGQAAAGVVAVESVPTTPLPPGETPHASQFAAAVSWAAVSDVNIQSSHPEWPFYSNEESTTSVQLPGGGWEKRPLLLNEKSEGGSMHYLDGGYSQLTPRAQLNFLSSCY